MVTTSNISSPTADDKSSVPVSESSVSGPEPQQSGSGALSVKLPPVSPHSQSATASQPHSILKVTSTSQPAPPHSETQPVSHTAEDTPQVEQPSQAAGSPELGAGDSIASDRPKQDKWHKSSWHTEAALLTSWVLAFLVASVTFVCAFLERYKLYQLNGLVKIGHTEVLPPEWIEVAVCFGPRLPAGALLKKVTDSAPTNVDDTFSYWQLFGDGGFDWQRSPFELLATPAAMVARRLGALQVTTSEPMQPELRYTDMPMMMHYSLCRNFSGFRWSPSRGDAEHWIELTLSTEEHNQLLDGVAASFVDVYAYQRGRFSEFYNVAPLLGYRTSMGQPLLLRLQAELHRDVEQCSASSDTTPCLFWCLFRVLLSRADCTMPWIDAMVYNMTAVRLLQRSVPTQRDPKLFSAKTALPWMAEFASLRPCATAAEFKTLFQLVDSLLLHENSAPDPEVYRCYAACPRHCTFLVTSLQMAGGTLAEWNSDSLLRIDVPHSVQAKHRRELVETPALLLELAGMSAFLFGATLLGIYGWCAASICWLLDRAGLLSKECDGGSCIDADVLVEKGGRPEAGDGPRDEDSGYRADA